MWLAYRLADACLLASMAGARFAAQSGAELGTNPMRKMRVSPIVTFVVLLAVAVVLATAATRLASSVLPAGEVRGVMLVALWILFYFGAAILVFRLFQTAWPLPPGDVAVGSRTEFVYHVYLLFYLLVFNPVMFSGLLPVPFMRMFYMALGARMGSNSFSVGVMLDPQFVAVGNNTIIGNGALLIPHVIEGERLAHYPIVIGSNVTVGARAVVLADVTIGDRATVAVGAVVPKGSRIGPGEIWGGIPARPISRVDQTGERL